MKPGASYSAEAGISLRIELPPPLPLLSFCPPLYAFGSWKPPKRTPPKAATGALGVVVSVWLLELGSWHATRQHSWRWACIHTRTYTCQAWGCITSPFQIVTQWTSRIMKLTHHNVKQHTWELPTHMKKWHMSTVIEIRTMHQAVRQDQVCDMCIFALFIRLKQWLNVETKCQYISRRHSNTMQSCFEFWNSRLRSSSAQYFRFW